MFSSTTEIQTCGSVIDLGQSLLTLRASLVAQLVKYPPAVPETWV